MTVYRVALRSFEEVEKHYCSVKPIRGTSIRPIGKRARKHEHIVKVSDDRYDIMSAFSALVLSVSRASHTSRAFPCYIPVR